MQKAKQTQKPEKAINPMVAGAAGAVIGVGMGVAAATALNDERTRETVKKTIKAAGTRMRKYVNDMQTEEMLANGKKRLKDSADSAVKQLESSSKSMKNGAKKRPAHNEGN